RGSISINAPTCSRVKPRFNRASLMAKPKALKSYLSSFLRIVDHLYTFYSAIDKYVHQCGFINHIDRITEACKQRNKSVYMLFWLFRTFYKVYLSVMQQIPLSHWD